jgi:hypothetical protein
MHVRCSKDPARGLERSRAHCGFGAIEALKPPRLRPCGWSQEFAMRSPFFSLAFKNQAPMNAERDPFSQE